jgi:hypothetical protein
MQNPLLQTPVWTFADMAVAQDWELERGNEGALIWTDLGPEMARMVCENPEVLEGLAGFVVEPRAEAWAGTGARAGARARAWARAGAWVGARARAWVGARARAGAWVGTLAGTWARAGARAEAWAGRAYV